MLSYYGYSYPHIFGNQFCQWVWKHLFCRINWHLWDETTTSTEHYLHCDACGITFPGEDELFAT